MKIDFHYFTIKFLAVIVGYSEAEAQLIATTCQFINDNNTDYVINIKKEYLSEEIIKRNLYEQSKTDPNMCKVPLLLSALLDDQMVSQLKDKTIQEQRLIPFYYFADKAVTLRDKYSVLPIKTLQTSSKFEKMFSKGSEMYNSQLSSTLTPDKVKALRRLGVLLHIASDSWAYAAFNGYETTKNLWEIEEAKDTRDFKNITDRYKSEEIQKYPNVGKFKTNSVTEDYNVQFIIQRTSPVSSLTQINNDQFVKMAKLIYEFLYYFRNEEPLEMNWEKNILPVLLIAWDTDEQSYAALKTHWEKASKLNTYNYDATVVKNTIVKMDFNLQPCEQGYFDFLLMLQDVRDAVTS